LLLLLLLLLLFLLRFFVFFFRVEGSASKGFGIERDLCAYKTNACSSSIRFKFVAGIVFAWIFVYIRFVLLLRFCSLFLLCVRACMRVCACVWNLGSFGLSCPLFAFDTFELCLPSLFLVGFPLHIDLKVVSPLDFREWAV
jgi:hypothetical protein